jgi:phosphomannomutase
VKRKSPIRFGTDGWRAVLAEEFTFENVARVAAAVAAVFKRRAASRPAAGRKILVGYDNRFLADSFARVAALVLRGRGLDARLSRASIPTPAASLFLHRKGWLGAVLLTASHNPPSFGGFKVKVFPGASADDSFARAVERAIPTRPPRSSHEAPPGVDVMPAYLGALREFADVRVIRRAGLRVAVDSMHGTGGRIIETLLRGGGTEVTTLRAGRDPLFGGGSPEPVPENLAELARTVGRGKFDVGIALDGDADRLSLLDARGGFVSPQSIMAVLADELLRVRGEAGDVAKTYAGTEHLDRIAKKFGRRCRVTPVGFKHVSRLMQQGRTLMGGEEAGGIGITSYMSDRDGIAVALLVLEIMARRRKSLRALVGKIARRYGPLHYRRVDFSVPAGVGAELSRALFEKVMACRGRFRLGGKRFPGYAAPMAGVETLDGVKCFFHDGAWLLFRASGTEPLLRVYAEAPAKKKLEALIKAGKKSVREVVLKRGAGVR